MPKNIQILFRNAHIAIDAAVRADLAYNGFDDVAPSHSALLFNVGEDVLARATSSSCAASQTRTTGAA